MSLRCRLYIVMK